MIIEKQKEAKVLVEGISQDSIGMSLDLDSAQILMQMLSKGLYSDSIGSTVRECASNALDSHRRTGMEKPIVVSFGRNSEDNYEFAVEDFGTGLDADDVKNIISKYGKSTKRNSNTELGMMGLGFKAPLAYSSSFYFTCRKDGVERKYMMYEGEDSNTIDLLYEKPTTEDNGVKVIVPVKWEDRNEFIIKIKEQLAYFESVYFNITVSGEDIKNDFVIYRHDLFQFSEIASDNMLHVCLDNVYYPLDFQKLGIDPIYIPVGLRFSLTDGLFPTPNRESLRYTQEAKKIIIDKIAEIGNYFVDKFNEGIKDTDNIQDVFNYYDNNKRLVKMLNSNFDISALIKYSTVKIKTPSLKGIKLLDLERLYTVRRYILGEYEIKLTLYRNKMAEQKSYYSKEISPSHVDFTKYHLYENTLGSNKKLYLKSVLSPSDTHYFVKKTDKMPLFGTRNGYDNYYTILNLNTRPRAIWRDVIKEFQSIRDLFLSKMNNLDEFEIPKQWLDNRRKKPLKLTADGKRVTKLKGEIIVKKAVDRENWSGDKNCKFVSQTYELGNMYSQNKLFVYTSHDQAQKLDPLYGMFKKQKIEFITLSARELAIVDKVSIHNLMPLNKFMEQKSAPFKRIATAYLINELIEKNKYVFDRRHLLSNVHTELYDKINELRQYHDSNFIRANMSIFEAIIPIAEEHKLFDIPTYNDYLYVKNTLDRLYFINNLLSVGSDYRRFEQELVDLMKYHKEKVNLNQYNVKTQEETAAE